MMTQTVRTAPSRSRTANRRIRRKQIISATIESINRVGFAETTLATVAKLAGMSQASLIFHFGSKDALLVETLQFLSDEHQAAWKKAYAATPDSPLARICALIKTDFSPHLCNRKKIAVWQAFWGEAKTRPTYLHICDSRDNERFEVMVRECGRLIAEDPADRRNPEDIASTIDGLSDGLWQRILINYKEFDRKDALRTMLVQLQAHFPNVPGLEAAWESAALGDKG